MTEHISTSGIYTAQDGFKHVECACGETLGPAPDEETMLDIAMEHAQVAGRTDLLLELTKKEDG